MASINVSTFNGTDQYLSRADEATLDIVGDLYFSCFVQQTSTSGAQTLASKTGGAPQKSWALGILGGQTWFGASIDGTNVVQANASGTLTAGAWYFIEARHTDSTHVLELAVTPVSQATVSSFGGGASLGGAIYDSTGAFQLGAENATNPLNGSMHSAVLLNELPTDAERSYLFNEGTGRAYWELDDTLKDKVVGFWQLNESSGTRASKTNSLTLTNNGTVGTTTRTVSIIPFGSEAGVLQAGRELVASSYAFQDWVGAASASAAEASVYTEANDTAIDTRPNALVMTDTKEYNQTVGPFAFGVLLVQFEADMTGSVDTEETRTIFQNRVGKIIQEMEKNGRAGGYLCVNTITEEQPITVAAKTEDGTPYFACRYQINYGVE